MKRRCFTPRRTVAVALLASASASAVAADPLANLPYVLTGGTPNLDLRLRYEQVDQDNFAENAEAWTARLRLGYTTGKWNAIDTQFEFEGLANLGEEDYNSTRNGVTRFPVVADPEGSEFNQVWLRYTGLPKTALKLGRQRLIYDNARHIGNVGWRQNEQTYDGLTLTTTALARTTFNYAWLSNVNSFRSFGANGVAPCVDGAACSDDLDIDAHLLNVAFVPAPWITATAYGYWLDFELDTAARRDTQTLGLRATGSVPGAPFKLAYALEIAEQSDHADAPDSVDASYRLIELGASWTLLNAKLGYELLSGDGVYGFQAPLATTHAFNGWADQFLATPATGLERIYVQLGTTVEKVALTAIWHQFEADEGGADYGSELDLMATRPINEQLSLGLKYAAYDADTFPVAAGIPIDTTKAWAWVEYKF